MQRKRHLIGLMGFGMGLLTLGWAQGRPGAAIVTLGDAIAGLTTIFLVLGSWAVFGIAVMPDRINSQVAALRNRSARCFWTGLIIALGSLIVLAALGGLSEVIKRQGQEPVLINLFMVVIIFALITVLLIGWVSVSLLLGEAVGRAFGREDFSSAKTVLIGAAMTVLLLAVPIPGWIILVYWAILSVGVFFSKGAESAEGTEGA